MSSRVTVPERGTKVPPAATAIPRVRTGADRLLSEKFDSISGKRVGLLTNHTGRLADGTSLADAIMADGRATITALFGPEHGITGNVPDGTAVGHSKHEAHDIPVFSLYGKTHKPTGEMLADVDVLVCDIQDVGARFYTYISTIALAIEAAAESRIPVVVLDRPAPIRGVHFDGPVRIQPLRSFVGLLPIPVTYGMTIGELMHMWNAEGWMAGGVRADLLIVELSGWRRTMWYDETGLTWIPPSPNLPRLETAIVYPGTCFFEGTTVSEGRGTDTPFECVGAPWADPERIIDILSQLDIAGVSFSATRFTPRTIPGVAVRPKFEGEQCNGIRISVEDRDKVRPVRLGTALLCAFKRAHPKETELRMRRFDILTGDDTVRKMIDRGADFATVLGTWSESCSAFGSVRARNLLYVTE